MRGVVAVGLGGGGIGCDGMSIGYHATNNRDMSIVKRLMKENKSAYHNNPQSISGNLNLHGTHPIPLCNSSTHNSANSIHPPSFFMRSVDG